MEYTEENTADGGVGVYTSLQQANDALMQKTLEIAKAAGYDTLQRLPTGFICGKHSSAESVEVYSDGTWEYRDATEDDHKTQTGLNAVTLQWYLEADAEGRKIFAE